MSPPRILVTPRSLTARQDHPALQPLREAECQIVFSTPGLLPAGDELISLLPGCSGWIAGVEPVTARVLDSAAAGDLRVISRNGAGVSNIDAAAAATRDIRILSAAGANANGVAELTLGLMLALARHLAAADAALKRREWPRETGTELRGKTLALAGCGRVGQEVARLALAFGMKVRALDPHPAARSFAQAGDFAWASDFTGLVRGADFLSLHCPPQTGGPLITGEILAATPPGLRLINTARAELVDETAILRALDAGHLAGYATDVLHGEPPADWTLAAHPRVLATPHLGANTRESIERATTAAVTGLMEALQLA